MGFEVNQTTPGWPQQLAMSTGKKEFRLGSEEGGRNSHLFIYQLFTYSASTAFLVL